MVNCFQPKKQQTKCTPLPLPSSSPPPPLPPSSSPPSSPASASPSPRKKRKYGDTTTTGPSSSPRFEKNEYYLPSPAADEGSEGAALLDGGLLDFHEILDEEALKHKFTVVNRAPVMMAWACVVAERLGFSRDE